MSLYNMINGINPLSIVLLKIVNLELSEIPRIRDTYVDVDRKLIGIYTRTGGGNDECYCGDEKCEEGCFKAMNDALRSKPNYVDDQYDDFDSTFATFYFNPKEEHQEIFNEILKHSSQAGSIHPSDKMKQFLENLQKETGATHE